MTPDWSPEDEPFLRPAALHTADRLTEAAVNLLRTEGVDALSVGALARAINVTPQAVLKDYPRARVIELICMVFGQRWESWAGPDREHDLPARLPRIPGERHGVQVLRALVELARGEEMRGRPAPAAILAGAVERERDRLGAELDRISDRRVSDDELARVHALVTGLRLALVDDPSEHERHLTWEAAAALLRRQVAELVVDNQLAKGDRS
jgi:AcrR family transcriptional regulator